MATIIRTEKRKRGVFGTLVWWLFLAFNVVMAYLIGTSFWFISHGINDADASVQAGTAIGGTMAIGAFLTFWIIGAAILGLIVALSRGKTVTVEKTVN